MLYKKERQLFKAYFTASVWLSCLKKVRDGMRSREYRFIEQGLCELKEEEKAISTRVVTSPGIPLLALLSPLTDPFVFNPLFSLLPDLLSYNTP